MESSKINRQNYEVFIVDYLDGNLGPVESAELLLFLELNPDIKKEMEGLSGAIPDQEPMPEYPFKEALKPAYDTDAVHITGENNTYYFIAYHEGDLSETGMQNVNEYLSKNPEFLSAFEAFRMSRLSSDSRIKYPEPGETQKDRAAVQNPFSLLFIRGRFGVDPYFGIFQTTARKQKRDFRPDNGK